MSERIKQLVQAVRIAMAGGARQLSVARYHVLGGQPGMRHRLFPGDPSTYAY